VAGTFFAASAAAVEGNQEAAKAIAQIEARRAEKAAAQVRTIQSYAERAAKGEGREGWRQKN
jgi:hypothetical protein